MNVLQVHEYYQRPGGEDQVVAAEARLLEEHGHEVRQFFIRNERVADYSRLALARATVWSTEGYAAIRDELRHHHADVMHVHNTLPLLSPSIYHAAAAEGVAVVQTLHNYRLVCPASTLYRDGQPCEACVGKKIAWPSVAYACYRGSRSASLAVTTMLAVHHARRTWLDRIGVYIALTHFAREVFVRGGLPADRIVVKPNFVHLDHAPLHRAEGRRYALFVGRLTPEKGIATLLTAWRDLGRQLPLKIVGDGPLAAEVADFVTRWEGVEWPGQRPRDEVLELMRGAYVLVFPSTWYEGFPVTLAEAFASALPVVASDLGSMGALVDDGRTGRTFAAGDPAALVEALQWTLAHPELVGKMGAEARREYEAHYAPAVNYEQLVRIYERAVQELVSVDERSGR